MTQLVPVRSTSPYHCSLPARLKCKSEVLVEKHRTRESTHTHACGHAPGPDLVPLPSVLLVPAQLQLLRLPRALFPPLALSLAPHHTGTQSPQHSGPYPELLTCLLNHLFLLLSLPGLSPGSVPLPSRTACVHPSLASPM